MIFRLYLIPRKISQIDYLFNFLNIRFLCRWDLTTYPGTSPMIRQILKKYLDFGEVAYGKMEQINNRIETRIQNRLNRNIDKMERDMKQWKKEKERKKK